MSAAMVAVGVALGAAVGFLAGRYWWELDRAEAARSEELAAAFNKGVGKGYMDGWTAGRIALVGEQTSKAKHPTTSAEAHVVRKAGRVVRLAEWRMRHGNDGPKAGA